MIFFLYVISCDPSVSDSACDCPVIEPSSDITHEYEVFWTSNEYSYATGLGLGDFDGDGDLDVVVSEGNDMEPGLIRIYHNQAGTLEEEASFTTQQPQYYGHLAVGDMNGDSWPDLVVSKFLGSERFDSPGGVEVFLNQGGTLSRLPDWTFDGVYTFALSLGDLEGDGDLDIALAVGESYFNEPEVAQVLCNNGSAEFESCWYADAPRYSFDVAMVDINRDGAQDLIFAHQNEGHTIHLSDGQQPSVSPSWQAQEGGFEGNTLDWGDIDGDGFLDIVVSDNIQAGGEGTIRGWCGPDFTLCWQSQDERAMQSALALRDVDYDGDLDLLAGAWWGAVRVYENDGGLSDEPVFVGQNDSIVAEAFAWGSLVESQRIRITGSGVVEIPDRRFVIQARDGVFCDGYVFGENIDVDILSLGSQDIFLSDWEPNHGNWGFMASP